MGQVISLDLWTIGELADRAGISASAVRCVPIALHRVTAILMCQQAGFTLDEISTMLEAPANKRTALARAKLERLDPREFSEPPR